ncbi:MAG: Ldh family oxidoreductase [Verrucomicrobia bacterium]|nr:Ldh family oxidoreductase [Verrucomicrobiota bacterium]
MKVFAPELEGFVVEVLTKVGISEADARTSAEVLVTTDTWGTFTHGVKNLRGYVRRIKGGGIRSNAVPKVVAEGPAWALVNGDSALGMVTSTLAMRAAMAKAKATGIGYAGVRNSCHFGAAGYYASMAAREGMVGVAMCNDVPSVTAPGARGAVMGSNPFAFAVPAGKEKPILLDMATSTVAGGKVFAAAALGKKIPDHWLVEAEGLPTSDPAGYPKTSTLTPMAGHKGYGLALFIETLSGLLTGAAFTRHVLSWSFDDPSLHTDHGAAFIAIHVETLMPGDQFRQRVDQMIREIHDLPKAQGAERIFLPGEMEWERRDKALVEGIELPEDVVMSLRALSQELGLDVNRILR